MRSLPTVRFLGFFVLFGLLAAYPRLTRAETTVGTEITSLPYTITASGVYYLNQDFKQNFPEYTAAIEVAASNVTIDFNGHFISTLTPAPIPVYGIYGFDRTNITVRNGTLIGFTDGIVLESTRIRPRRPSFACLVEDMLISNCISGGIRLDADDSQVRRCRVIRMLGSPGAFYAGSLGIYMAGSGSRILENDVSDLATVTQYPTIGIYCSGDGFGSMIVGNRVDGADHAIYCNYDSTGVYRDNLVSMSPTPFYGLYWQNGGGNNF